MENDWIDRTVLTLARNRKLEVFAIRALLRATELLGLVLGLRLGKLRDSDDRFASLFAESESNALLARLYTECAIILGERWDHLPERRRPHYRPHERYRILRIRKLLALSIDETARLFRVSSETISRWEADVLRNPDSESVGSLVKPEPPVRRFADVVRSLIQSMALCGFGGSQKIAETLARAGWKLSKRTVSRVLAEPVLGDNSPSTDDASVSGSRTLIADYPNHIFMADLTDVPSLFGLFRFKLALVLDVYSRMPLAFRVFHFEPSAESIAELLKRAIERFGVPKHFVSDRGSQFTSKPFAEFLATHGIQHRFGAIGKTGSIAVIERFWRTLKSLLLLPALRPLGIASLEARLNLALAFYSLARPHHALGGRTPADVYFQREPAELSPPPRARPGEGPRRSPFEIRCLDPRRTLPLLLRKAA